MESMDIDESLAQSAGTATSNVPSATTTTTTGTVTTIKPMNESANNHTCNDTNDMKDNSWESKCRLINRSNDFEEILTLLREIIHQFETTISQYYKTEPEHEVYRSYIITMIPLCSVLITTKTSPTQNVRSIPYQIRFLILEFWNPVIQTHITNTRSNPTNPTNAKGNHASFTLRTYATSIIGMMMHIVQYDYESLSVIAIRMVFDLYKYYRTSISNEHIPTFLDFCRTLYRNLPQAVKDNFRTENLLQYDHNSSSRGSSNNSTDQKTSLISGPTSITTAVPTDPVTDAMEIDPPRKDKATIANTTTTSSSSMDCVVVDAQKVMDIIDHSFNSAMVTTDTVSTPGNLAATTKPLLSGQPQPMDVTTTTTTTYPEHSTKDVESPQNFKTDIPASSLSIQTALSSTSSLVGIGSSSHRNNSDTNRPRMVSYKSNVSFQVLTECPLIVMLVMFQLYPQQYIKPNVVTFIQLMMEALSLRPPPIPSIAANTAEATTTTTTSSTTPSDNAEHLGTTESATNPSHGTSKKRSDVITTSSYEQMHMIRARELVAAQAKTLSFLTYLLRTYVSELKPYESTFAGNVIALMAICPRDAISIRKELLAATRLILSSEFRTGFFNHIDAMLDERILMGGTTNSSHYRPDPIMIRPLAYMTLADFVQHARTLFSMTQMSKVVCQFSRILHDTSIKIPLSIQYTAIRTLISVIDIVYHNKDPDPQIGRDVLVRLVNTMIDKLQALNAYYPELLKAEQQRNLLEMATLEQCKDVATRTKWLLETAVYYPTTDTVREVQNLIRTIIVSQKSIFYYVCTYRNQQLERVASGTTTAGTVASGTVRDPTTNMMPPLGSNEEVSSALLKLTHTEIAMIDRYIPIALTSMKLLSEAETVGHTATSTQQPGTTIHESGNVEKSPSELHRDALTYFAATFTAMDGFNLRRSLGRRMDMLVDAIVDRPNNDCSKTFTWIERHHEL
jgi:hypothetical protein